MWIINHIMASCAEGLSFSELQVGWCYGYPNQHLLGYSLLHNLPPLYKLLSNNNVLQIIARKYQHVCILRSKAASLIHISQHMSSVHNKIIISAACRKQIQILDTVTDIRITRISVAALQSTDWLWWLFSVKSCWKVVLALVVQSSKEIASNEDLERPIPYY